MQESTDRGIRARASCVVHLIADGLIVRSSFPSFPCLLSPTQPRTHPSHWIFPRAAITSSRSLGPAVPRVSYLVTTGRLVNISIHPSRLYRRLRTANWPSCILSHYAIVPANIIEAPPRRTAKMGVSTIPWPLEHTDRDMGTKFFNPGTTSAPNAISDPWKIRKLNIKLKL